MVPEGMSPRLAARRAARYGNGGGPPPLPPDPPTEEWPPPAHRSRDPGPRPPGRPGRRWWRWALGGAAVLVLSVALAPPPLVDPYANRAAAGYESECAELSGVEVDSGAWPAVIRAGMGELRDVSAHTDEVRFENDLTIHDVDFSAERIEVAPLRFGTVDEDAVVHGGRSSATVLLDDIEAILAGYGVTVDLRGDRTSMVADVLVPILGVVPTTVELVPVDGDLELRFAALAVIALPSLLIELPEPVALDSALVEGTGLRVTTTVDGTIPAEEWGCDSATSTGG